MKSQMNGNWNSHYWHNRYDFEFLLLPQKLRRSCIHTGRFSWKKIEKGYLQNNLSRYILKRKEMPNLNLVISTFGLKTANCLEDVGGFIFYSLSFFFRKESNAITVLATVATQVTTAITNSKVITRLPIQLFQQKPIRVGSRERRLKAGKLRVTQQF